MQTIRNYMPVCVFKANEIGGARYNQHKIKKLFALPFWLFKALLYIYFFAGLHSFTRLSTQSYR